MLLFLVLNVGAPGGKLRKLLGRALVEAFPAIEGCHGGHVAICELEVEDIDVVGDVRRILGAWNDDISLLDMPTHNDLSRRFAILDSEVAHDGLVHDAAVAAPAERVPRLQCNVVLGEQLLQFSLREIRMALDLNEGWNDLAIREKLLDFVLVEIGDSDGAELAFLVRSLKLLIAPSSSRLRVGAES